MKRTSLPLRRWRLSKHDYTGIMAEYATPAPSDTFTISIGDRHPTDLAGLRGARLVSASETEQGRTWAETRIKTITGGDAVSARFMRGDFFSFRPTFKLMIIGNHRPKLESVDAAVRRRFNIVPFTHKPEHPDHQLEKKLREEWPEILRWMIKGALDWQKHGLLRPQRVLAATEDLAPRRFGKNERDCEPVHICSAWHLLNSRHWGF